MPDATPVPVLQDVDFESSPLRLATDALSDQEALSLVKRTFNDYEQWRLQNHDRRWQIHDQLYFAQQPQDVWPGTNVPKASLPSYMIFSAIENTMPALMEGLFGQDDWFSVVPEPGAKVEEAKAIEAHLNYVFNHSFSEFGTAEEEFEAAIRQILKYGNGGLMLEWDKGKPVVQFVDIKDLYIDPGLNSPALDKARSVIYRTEMTVDELDAYREDDRMKIPSKSELVYMSRNRPIGSSDRTKVNSEAVRKVNYVPGVSDNLPFPADNRIEVLIYYSKSRIIWVLNREWVAYREKNPYGFIPFCFAPCYTVESRFYAQGYADVLEPSQQYAAKLRNMRLDQISLTHQPPRTRKRGGALPPSKLRWQPGLVDEVANPKEDVIVHMMSNDPTAQTENDVAAISLDAERITGSNSVAQGVPRPGNVNRTKGGVDSQISAAASRLSLIGRHIERYLMVPMLYKMYRMIQLNTEENDLLPALGEDDKYFTVGAEAFRAPVKFRMLGPSRMMTQGKLAQQVPFLMQYVGNPGIMQPLNALGYTVDFMEVMKMIQDSTGINKHYTLVRPLNPQEQQALQQPNAQIQAEMQKTQAEHQNRVQLTQMKTSADLQGIQLESQTDLQIAQIGKEDPQTAMQMAQMELQKAREEMALERERFQMEMQQMQQEHALKMQQGQQKASLDAHLGQQKMQTEAQMAQSKVAIAQLSGQQQIQHQEQSHQQQLRQMEQTGGLKAQQTAESGKVKLQATSAMNKEKLKTEEHKRKLLAGSGQPKKPAAKAKK